MLLKYAPKRMSFQYQYYTDRMHLAAIDHNIHHFRKNLTSKKGNVVYVRKYNKRSKKFIAQPLKEVKRHPHVRMLLSKIIKRRVDHTTSIAKSVTPVHPRNPKLISPSIGGNPPPTSDLVARHVSRLKKKYIDDVTFNIIFLFDSYVWLGFDNG